MNEFVKAITLLHQGKRLEMHYLIVNGNYLLWQARLQRFYLVDAKMDDYIRNTEEIDLDANVFDPMVKEFEALMPMFDAFEQMSLRQAEEGGIQLTINISHDCNMRCKYCFASFGSYGREDHRGIMDIDTARTIPVVFKNQRVSHVMFFGGEPLMNYQAIDEICKGFAVSQTPPPSYGLVTNGTIVTEQILDILKKNSIPVTVSIDGHQLLHDELRPFISGQGTFDTVVKNIRVLQDFGISVFFEATYTQQHEQAGISPVELVDGLKKKLGISRGTLGFCEGDAEEGYAIPFDRRAKYSDELTDYFLDQLMNDSEPYIDDDWLSLLSSLLNQSSRPHLCPVGEKAFALTPEGDVTMC